MKFMRLGSRPDFFSTRGNVTSVRSDLMSDIVLDVDGHKFKLHLFPLLAKCGALHKLVTTAVEAGEDEVKIDEFPGSAECFEICAKFCYGVTITLNAHNVGEVRCGAEYLKMSETVEKSNLTYKLEVFLNSSILRGWKDSIICLQSSKDYQPWSEDLNIISRCIESIASKMVVDPAKVDWSFSYSRVSIALDHVSVSQPNSPALWSGSMQGCPWLCPVPKDWWVEDICDLDTDLFWRVMTTAKAKGVANDLVAEALQVYAQRWLPGVCDEQTMAESTRNLSVDYSLEGKKHRQMLETIVNLLPAERGSSTCSFLLKLLKAATILNASPTSKEELARRVGVQLEEATLRDMLIPSPAYVKEIYDVDVVIQILEHYLLQNQSPPMTPPPDRSQTLLPERRRTRSTDFASVEISRRSTAMTHGSKLIVAKLIDSYLAEIARDPNLSVAKFMQLAESIPDFARTFHDGLYRAIDMYLKEHPNLQKGDRKKICRLMDCQKLSMDACMHAAQNERLPLRTVVQVLFFEQVRSAATGGYILSDMPSSIRALVGQESGDDRSQMSDHNMHADNVPSVSASGEHGCYVLHQDFSTLKDELTHLKSRIADAETRQSFAQDCSKPSKPKSIFSKPKKFLQKLFSKKVYNSASSRDSDTQSTVRPTGGQPVKPRLQRRHSMV